MNLEGLKTENSLSAITNGIVEPNCFAVDMTSCLNKGCDDDDDDDDIYKKPYT